MYILGTFLISIYFLWINLVSYFLCKKLGGKKYDLLIYGIGAFFSLLPAAIAAQFLIK